MPRVVCISIPLAEALRYYARLRHPLHQCIGKLSKIFNRFSYLCFTIEPIGSKGPKFSNDLRSSTIDREEGQSFGLLCLAQAFPVPTFRYFSWVLYTVNCFPSLFCLEPVGAKAPSFSTNNKISWFFYSEMKSFAILCPAQGFPVPSFR